MNKLEEICANKREEVAVRKAATSIATLESLAIDQSPPRGFEAALRSKAKTGFALIAEIKKASPSKGCLLYTSPSPRDLSTSRMPSSA